jgi:hypothetical protein
MNEKVESKKFFNLDLEVLSAPDLNLAKYEQDFIISNLEKGGNSSEFEQWILNNPEILNGVFTQLSTFIEDVMTPNKILVQSNKMLKFYKRYFRQKQSEDVLFVMINPGKL